MGSSSVDAAAAAAVCVVGGSLDDAVLEALAQAFCARQSRRSGSAVMTSSPANLTKLMRAILSAHHTEPVALSGHGFFLLVV